MPGREQELSNPWVDCWSNVGICRAFQEHFKWHWWRRFTFLSVWEACPDSVRLLAEVRQIHFLGKGYLKPRGLLSADSSFLCWYVQRRLERIQSTNPWRCTVLGLQCQKLSPEPKICQLKIELESSRDAAESKEGLGTKLNSFLQVQKTADTESIYKLPLWNVLQSWDAV